MMTVKNKLNTKNNTIKYKIIIIFFSIIQFITTVRKIHDRLIDFFSVKMHKNDKLKKF